MQNANRLFVAVFVAALLSGCGGSGATSSLPRPDAASNVRQPHESFTFDIQNSSGDHGLGIDPSNASSCMTTWLQPNAIPETQFRSARIVTSTLGLCAKQNAIGEVTFEFGSVADGVKVRFSKSPEKSAEWKIKKVGGKGELKLSHPGNEATIKVACNNNGGVVCTIVP